MSKILFICLFCLGGCSLQKVALRSSTPVFEKSSQGMMKEANWNFFRNSAPGNLKMIELLWLQDQENKKLLALLVQGFSGYGFAVPETLFFRDELAAVEDSRWKKEAISFYTRSLDYGLIYLKKIGVSKDMLLSNDETSLRKKLKDVKDEDLQAILYTAQSWASLITLQKDNVALISHIPKVKILFDNVCSRKPNIDQNVCDLFYAQYESTRPRMFGGNPELGEKIYLSAIEKHPYNLLLRVSYLQYVVIPGYQKEKYEKQARILKEEIKKWDNLNRDSLDNTSPYKDHQELNLYNSIARKRFEFIEQFKEEIF